MQVSASDPDHCHPATMRPLVAVELDDRSHQRDSRQSRDLFLDEIFRIAGLPLVRFTCRAGYVEREVTEALAEHLPHSTDPDTKGASFQ